MKRPLVMVALFYSGGLLLADFFQPPLFVLLVASPAVLGGALVRYCSGTFKEREFCCSLI